MQVSREKIQEIVSIMDIIESDKNKKLNDQLTFKFFINRRLLKPTYEEVEEWLKKLREKYIQDKKITEADLMANTEAGVELRKGFEKLLDKNKEHKAFMEGKVEINFEKMNANEVQGSSFNTSLMTMLDPYLFN